MNFEPKSLDFVQVNIEIIHVFLALTFAGSGGSWLNMMRLGWVLKHLLRDPASINARNKHVWSLFLHVLPESNQYGTENVAYFKYMCIFKLKFMFK